MLNEGTRSFALLIDRLVHKQAVEIAARQGIAIEDGVDAVYRSLEKGVLRLTHHDGSPLRIEPGGTTPRERRAAREANRQLMKVRRARMPDGHAFED